MQVFYNQKGIGDVLIIPLKSDDDRTAFNFETFGDVVKVTHSETNELLGYNIFKASSYFELEENGGIKLTEELLNSIHEVFNQNNLDEKLDVDLSPKFVVGYVKEKAPHENADKLSVCSVDVGKETLQIVCGAPNVEAGQRVVVAKVGATMPSGLAIKPTELRGVPSNGMICSAKELNLPDAPKEKGILVLEEAYSIGEEFTF